MSVVGKKLLILAGAEVHCRVVKTAKEMGVYTIVTDYLADSPAKKIADENLMLSILDTDAIIAYCRENSVDGVINICNDPGQKAHQQICEALGLPCYGNADQVFKLSNKPAFKEMCLSNGVDVIPEYSLEDVMSGKVQLPVFIKPVDSRGSRGQTICHSLDEIEPAVKFASSESSNGKYIIEKYMGGKDDFSLTYLVCGGVPCLFRTADRHLGDIEYGLSRETVASISPSVYTQLYKEKLEAKVLRQIERLGIMNGPVLMQGFVDGDSIYFYDPGIRFPGNAYEMIYEKAMGINLMKILIEYSLGEDISHYANLIKDSYQLRGKRLIQIMYNLKPGTIQEIRGVEEILANPAVIDVKQHYKVGDVIFQTGDFKQRGFEVDILIDDTKQDIERVISYINKTLKVLDTKGEDMYASPLNPQRTGTFYQ